MPYVSSFALEQHTDVLFELLKPLIYDDPILKIRITTPVSFWSDGPSTPRAPIVFTLLGGKGKRGGVTHDYLYRNKLLKRKYDDLIFYHALQEHKNITKFGAWAMYKAVDVCGDKHRNESRPLCLNTYHKCEHPVCIGPTLGCPRYDKDAYRNIEFLPGCTIRPEELFVNWEYARTQR